VQISGKASNVAPGVQTLELQAINTNDETGACEAALTGVNSVDLAFECENPATCGASSLDVSGTSVSGTNSGGSLNYTGVNLDFGDATDTTATFVITYPDAGLIQLHARNTLSPSGETMLGASNDFVVRPFALGFTNIVSSATSNPAGTASSGSGFIVAGVAFSYDVTAYRYAAGDDLNSDGIMDAGSDPTDNGVTPAFGAQTTLAVSAITPAGGATGTLSPTSISAGTFQQRYRVGDQRHLCGGRQRDIERNQPRLPR